MDVDDLLVEILVRLTVSSLSRFKSVCKSWYALISAPDFVHRHATFEDKSKLGTFIFQYQPKSLLPYPRQDERPSVDPPHFFTLSGDQFEVRKDLGVPPLHDQCDEGGILSMVGSCHGIICLQYYQHNVYQRNPDDLYLWNPATKRYRILPRSLTLSNELDPRIDSVAFGFDDKAKDFKVLKASKFSHRSPRRVQVYSLNTNSWRYIDPKIYDNIHLGCLNQGQYLNGKYYLVGTHYHPSGITDMIFSFDFSEEKFRTLSIMNHYVDVQDQVSQLQSNLQSIGDKVAYIYRYLYVYDNNKYIHDIWELNGSGKDVDEFKSASWTRRCTIGPMPYWDLIAISKNGKMGIISDGKALQMVNLITQEAKYLQSVDNIYLMPMSCDYKESLASL